MVTIFEDRLELISSRAMTIPFTVDDVSNVTISVGGSGKSVTTDRGFLSIKEFDSNSEGDVTFRIETQDGLPVEGGKFTNSRLVFEGKSLAMGSYNLIIKAASNQDGNTSKVKIAAESDLQMETIVIPSTLNTDKQGLIEATLFYKDNSTPIEDARVSIGRHIFDNAGGGVYTSVFPPMPTTEFVSLPIYARGSFQGIVFQRHCHRIARPFSGELVFTGPYSWQILRDANNPSKSL